MYVCPPTYICTYVCSFLRTYIPRIIYVLPLYVQFPCTYVPYSMVSLVYHCYVSSSNYMFLRMFPPYVSRMYIPPLFVPLPCIPCMFLLYLFLIISLRMSFRMTLHISLRMSLVYPSSVMSLRRFSFRMSPLYRYTFVCFLHIPSPYMSHCVSFVSLSSPYVWCISFNNQ